MSPVYSFSDFRIPRASPAFVGIRKKSIPGRWITKSHFCRPWNPEMQGLPKVIKSFWKLFLTYFWFPILTYFQTLCLVSLVLVLFNAVSSQSWSTALCPNYDPNCIFSIVSFFHYLFWIVFFPNLAYLQGLFTFRQSPCGRHSCRAHSLLLLLLLGTT